MKYRIALSILAVLALAFLASSCQQPKSAQASALSAEDVTAVGRTIDLMIESYVAKDVDRFMTVFDANVVNMEYERCYRGIADMRENHIKPEIASYTMATYKPEDRHIQGQGGFAYVNERNIIEFKGNDGKTHNSDSVWASYVLEKKSDGNWKIVQLHFSGPPL